jgi:hypothetical protein
MFLRWAASALVATEKNFRPILGYQSLPVVVAKLEERSNGQDIARKEKVA